MPTQEVAIVASLGAIGMALLWAARRRDRLRTNWVAGAGWASKRPIYSFVRPENLLVITDFDATLTTGDSEQCHDLCGFSRHMSKEFRDEFSPLLDWQSNAAIDGVEWWDKAHELMVTHGMPPRPIIPRLVREAKMVPRPGSLELLKRLEQLNIPVLIVSAGLSDVIEEYLRQYGALSENITVCSNRLNYSADSAPKSVSPEPPITSFTKTYAYSSASTFFAQHTSRRSVICLGDSITDIDAAKNVPYERCLNVGFLNDRPSGIKHAETFDAVVLGNDGSLLPVADLIEEIAPQTNLMRSASRAAINGIASLGAAPKAPWLDESLASP